MGPEFAEGSVTSFPYFQTVDNPANHKFVEDVKRTMGADTVTYHAMECTHRIRSKHQSVRDLHLVHVGS